MADEIDPQVEQANLNAREDQAKRECVLPSRRNYARARKLQKQVMIDEHLKNVANERDRVVAQNALQVADEVKATVAKEVEAAAEIVIKAQEVQRRVEETQDQIIRQNLTNAAQQSKIEELMMRHGVDPVDELIKMAMEQLPGGAGFRLTPEQRISIWSKLVEYRHPKLSALKSTGIVDRSLTVIVRKTLARHKQEVPRARTAPIEVEARRGD